VLGRPRRSDVQSLHGGGGDHASSLRGSLCDIASRSSAATLEEKSHSGHAARAGEVRAILLKTNSHAPPRMNSSHSQQYTQSPHEALSSYHIVRLYGGSGPWISFPQQKKQPLNQHSPTLHAFGQLPVTMCDRHRASGHTQSHTQHAHKHGISMQGRSKEQQLIPPQQGYSDGAGPHKPM
jgi:hypothetical protein